MSAADHRAAAAASLQRTTQAPDSAKPGSASVSTRDLPTHDQIAQLAYQLWEERGRPEGSAEEDWLRAEKQLLG